MASQKSDFIDIPGLVRQYLSKWWLFAISLIICVGFSLLYIFVHKPDYAVRANVLINQDENDGATASLSTGMSAFGSLFGNNGFVYDEIFIISSHSLYRDVAKELGLGTKYYVRKDFLRTDFAFRDYPVKVTPSSGMLDTLSVGIKFVVDVKKDGKTSIKGISRKSTFVKVKDVTLPYTLESPLGTFTFSTTDYYNSKKDLRETILLQGYDSAAEELDVNVNSEIASKRSNVVEMSINTPYPHYGEIVLNKIIELYNKRGILLKNDQNSLTAKFIDTRLELLSKDLNLIETEIQQYKQKRGIIDVGLEAGKQFEKQTELENSLLKLRTQKELIQMASEFISEPANKYSLVPVAANAEGIPASLSQYNSMILERQEFAKTVHSDNIALKRLDNRIATVRDNIMASFAKTLENVDVKIKDINRTMAETNAKLGTAPLSEREFLNLQRQQQLKQSLYMFLLQRREEVAMVLANAFPKGTVIDEAFTLSDPLGISKKIILLLALIFAFALPPIALFIRKFITNRIESRKDVEKATEIPILGEICEDNSGEKIVVTSGNNSSAAELFRLLRTNLRFVLDNPNDKVVLLTSSFSGEGKSFISINLAASLAALDMKVILVGMDIRKPVLSGYLGIKSNLGVTQYLSGQDVELARLINKVPGVENLSVMLSGPIPPNPAELLASPKVDSMFTELRKQFDYIIVDTAPIGLVSDTFTLDRIADASIFVCRMNHTKLNMFEELNDIYEKKRLKKLSIIINGAKARKTYGYGN